MRRRSKPGLTAILLAAIGLSGPAAAADQRAAPESAAPASCSETYPQPVRVQVGTVEVAVEVGKELPVPIRVKGVCDLAAFKVAINLDRHIAVLARTEATPFLQGEPPVDYEYRPSSPERYVVTASRPQGAPGVEGYGTLTRLILKGVRPGATQVEMLHLQLFDSKGDIIETLAVPLRLTVVTGLDSGWKPYSTPKIKKPSP